MRNRRGQKRLLRQQQATGRFANEACKSCGHAEEMHLFSTKGLPPMLKVWLTLVTIEVSTIRPDGRVRGACDSCGCNNFNEGRTNS